MKSYVRLLFLLIIPFLFIQFWVSMKYSEPYPAIVLPAFKGVPKQDSCIALTRFEVTVFFENQDSFQIDVKDIFNQIPDWHIYHLLTTIFESNQTEIEQIEQGKYQLFQAFLKKRIKELTQRQFNHLQIDDVKFYQCKNIQKEQNPSILKSISIPLNE